MADKLIVGQSGLTVANDKFLENIRYKIQRDTGKEVLELFKNDTADAALYQTDRQLWRKKHGYLITQLLIEKEPVIAEADFKALKNIAVLGENSVILQSFGSKKFPSKYALSETDKIYGKIGRTSLEKIFNLQAGDSNVFRASKPAIIKYQRLEYGVKQTTDKIIEGIKNAVDKNQFVAWDTETFGGINKFGKQSISKLTEFSFGVYDYTTGELVNNRFYGSIIGATSEEVERYKNIIQRAENKLPLTGEEEIIYHRLALMGKSKLNRDNGSGIFTYKHFADKSEIANFDPQNARKGLAQLEDIGKKQLALGKTVTYKGQQMYAWEKTYLEGLDTIFSEELTAVGYNTKTFDNAVNRYQLQHGMWSAGAKKVAENLLQKFPDLTSKYEVDLLGVVRQFAPDRLHFLRDENGNIDDEDLKFIRQNNLTLRQQETLEQALKISAQNSAHTSAEDIRVAAKIFTNKAFSLTDNDSILKSNNLDKVIEIKGDGTQLFHATSGRNPADFNLLGFFTDPLSGKIRTADGYILGDKDYQNFFTPGTTRKGVSYTIDNIAEIETLPEFQDFIKEHYPALDTKKLIAVKFTPQTTSDNLKAQMSHTILGLESDIQNYINHDFIYTANRDLHSDGTFGAWQEDISEENKKLMEKISYRKHGKVSRTENFSVDAQLEESTKKITEASNRLNREKDAYKDLGSLRYIEEREKYVEFAKQNPSLFYSDQQKQRISELENKLTQAHGNYSKISGQISDFQEQHAGNKYFSWLNELLYNSEVENYYEENNVKSKIRKNLLRRESKALNYFIRDFNLQSKKKFSDIKAAVGLLEKENSVIENRLNIARQSFTAKLQKNFLNANLNNGLLADMISRWDETAKKLPQQSSKISVDKLKAKFIRQEIKGRNNFVTKILRPEIANEIMASRKQKALQIKEALNLIEKEHSEVQKYINEEQRRFTEKLQQNFLNANSGNETFLEMLDRMYETVDYAKQKNPKISTKKIQSKFIKSKLKDLNKLVSKVLRPEIAEEIEYANRQKALQIEEALNLIEEEYNFVSEQVNKGVHTNKAHKEFLAQHQDNQLFLDFIAAEDKFVKTQQGKDSSRAAWSLREDYRYILETTKILDQQRKDLLKPLSKEEIAKISVAENAEFKEISQAINLLQQYNDLSKIELSAGEKDILAEQIHGHFVEQYADNEAFINFIDKENKFVTNEMSKGNNDFAWNLREGFRYILEETKSLDKERKKLLKPLSKSEIAKISVANRSEFQEFNQAIDELQKYIALSDENLPVDEKNNLTKQLHEAFVKQNSTNKKFLEYLQGEDKYVKTELAKGSKLSEWEIRENYRYILEQAKTFRETANKIPTAITRSNIKNLNPQEYPDLFEIDSALKNLEENISMLDEEDKAADKISKLEEELFDLKTNSKNFKGSEKGFEVAVFNKTKALTDKIKSGEAILPEDLENTFYDYFGYSDRETKSPKVFMETVANQLGRLKYVEQNKDLILHALQLAHQKAGIDHN